MKNVTIVLVVVISFSFITKSVGQRSTSPLETFLATKDAAGKTMIFTTESKSTPIWYPKVPHIIDTENWNHPVNLTIVGNYSYDQKGWDINDTPYNGNPQLGKAKLYIVTVSVPGNTSKNASFQIESYGKEFNGDVRITYNYEDDKFYYRGTTDTIETLDMYDDPSWLQPTSPKNFHCTNSSSYGSHPHFTWEKPNHPTGVNFKYNIYQSVDGGPYYRVALILQLQVGLITM